MIVRYAKWPKLRLLFQRSLVLTLLFVGYPFGDTARTDGTEALQFVANIEHEHPVLDLAWIGSILAVADGTRIVRLYDASDLENPDPVGSITTDVPVSHLGTDGRRYLVTAGHGPSTARREDESVYEVADLGVPGDLATSQVFDLPAPPLDLAWNGDRILIALGEAGFLVIEAEFDAGARASSSRRLAAQAEVVAVRGPLGFVARAGNNSTTIVSVLDLTDGDPPRELSSIEIERRIAHLAATNGWLAMGTIGGGIAFADVSDPESVPSARLSGGTASATSLDAADDYVYSAWGQRGGLKIFDTVLSGQITSAVFVADLADAGALAVSATAVAVVEGENTILIARRIDASPSASTPMSPSSGGCR